MTATQTVKLQQFGKMRHVGHYSNLRHVLDHNGQTYAAKYKGDQIINGKMMARFIVGETELFTHNVATNNAIAWVKE